MDDAYTRTTSDETRRRLGGSSERASLDGLIDALRASVDLLEAERPGFTDPGILQAMDLMIRASTLALDAALEKRGRMSVAECRSKMLAAAGSACPPWQAAGNA